MEDRTVIDPQFQLPPQPAGAGEATQILSPGMGAPAAPAYEDRTQQAIVTSCPVCGTPVQRLVYAENEANYCPGCQTGGRLLADRALSRLLKDDWPRTLEELEARKRG